jgi:hypothetical protein
MIIEKLSLRSTTYTSIVNVNDMLTVVKIIMENIVSLNLLKLLTTIHIQNMKMNYTKQG